MPRPGTIAFDRAHPRTERRPQEYDRGSKDARLDKARSFGDEMMNRLHGARDEIERLDSEILKIKNHLIEASTIDLYSDKVYNLQSQLDAANDALRIQRSIVIKLTNDLEREAQNGIKNLAALKIQQKVNEVTAKSMKETISKLEEQNQTSVLKCAILSDEIDDLEQTIIDNDESKKKELIALQDLRRENFAYLAFDEYIKTLKKIDAPAGEFEIQALAEYLKRKITIFGQNRDDSIYIRKEYNPTNLSATVITGSAQTEVKLIFNDLQSEPHFDFLDANKTYNIIYASAASSVQPTTPHGYDLFDACIRALKQIDQIDAAQQSATTQQTGAVQPIIEDDSLLFVAGYALRINVCKYIESNPDVMLEIFHKIVTAFEIDPSQKVQEANLRILLEVIPAYNKLKGKIKTLLVQSYMKYFRGTYVVHTLEHVDNNDSDRTLSSIEDTTRIFDENITFAKHEKQIDNFLKNVSKRYVENISVKMLGGPLEMQAIADIYGCTISFSAYRNGIQGSPGYTKTFISKNAKSTGLLIELHLVNSVSNNARYKIGSIDPHAVDPETGLDEAPTIFAACFKASTTANKPLADINRIVTAVKKHLESKITRKVASKDILHLNPFKEYFENYIYANYAHDHISDNELIASASIQLFQECEKIKEDRSGLLKLSNILINQLSDKLQNTIVDWPSVPINEDSSTYTRLTRSIYATDIVANGMLLGTVISNLAVSLTVMITAINKVAPDPAIDSLSIIISFISGLQQCIELIDAENKKRIVIKGLQDQFINNLSIELLNLSESHFVGLPGFHNVETQDDLAFYWLSANGFKFKLNGNPNEFKILKYESSELSKRAYLNLFKLFRNMNVASISGQLISSAAAIGMSRASAIVPQSTGTNDTQVANLTTSLFAMPLLTSIDPTVAPTSMPVATYDFKATYAAAGFAGCSLFLNLIMLLSSKHLQTKNYLCEFQLKQALLAVIKSYGKGSHRTPKVLTEMLLRFGDDGVLSNALANAPKIQNIQRTMEKSRDDLRKELVKIESLSASYTGDLTMQANYNKLLEQIKELLHNTEPQHIDQIYLSDSKSKEIFNVITDIGTTTDKLTKNNTPQQNLMFSSLSGMMYTMKKTITFSKNKHKKG